MEICRICSGGKLTRYDVGWMSREKTREIKDDLLGLTLATGWIVVRLSGMENII